MKDAQIESHEIVCSGITRLRKTQDIRDTLDLTRYFAFVGSSGFKSRLRLGPSLARQLQAFLARLGNSCRASR
jgi:hypothetical protein